MKSRKPKRGYIFVALDDYHYDGCDAVHEITPAEWVRLIAPAIKGGYPIDGATVDGDLLSEIMNRPEIGVSSSEFKLISTRIPLV